MSLDFTVSEITESIVDEQGRNTYTTTELANFGHAGYKMMDYGLGRQENCTTVAYDAAQFLECLDKMLQELKEMNETGVDKYNEKIDLVDAIDELQYFVETEEITKDTNRVFDIRVWY